ncbi:hypothetical protein [Olivibacter domesticus]|uniref:Uncharacterized protein n=1 Tax=Olivibacter domesticus TaxID=407022 RepID=A0A1H7WR15_OLID1|nr:hypothetical protein [Olivibacter domesticus]SEM23419.1 hypothetical protein SAMN05661044_04601 [Olivibacter domesticus]
MELQEYAPLSKLSYTEKIRGIIILSLLLLTAIILTIYENKLFVIFAVLIFNLWLGTFLSFFERKYSLARNLLRIHFKGLKWTNDKTDKLFPWVASISCYAAIFMASLLVVVVLNWIIHLQDAARYFLVFSLFPILLEVYGKYAVERYYKIVGYDKDTDELKKGILCFLIYRRVFIIYFIYFLLLFTKHFSYLNNNVWSFKEAFSEIIDPAFLVFFAFSQAISFYKRKTKSLLTRTT